MVKFLDLKKINDRHRTELDQALLATTASGHFILGEMVRKFEAEFAHFCDVKHCIGVASGLDALALILQAYRELGQLHDGDEVIVPANTFIASMLAISRNNLQPVLVEPDIGTYNLDPNSVIQKIGPKTRAIMAVDLYGQPADLEKLAAIAQSHRLLLIEDAAQAHGARLQGRRAGSFGHAAGFSFYPAKNLGAFGDAGAITTHDDALADIIRQLRNYGSKVKYYNLLKGYNSRLDEMQAAVLSVKLPYLDQDNKARRKVADTYRQVISNPLITLPEVLPGCEPVWHLFVIRVEQRDRFQTYLRQAGIESIIHYPIPPHKQEAYREWHHLRLPITEKIHREVLSLPMSPVLTTEEVDRVSQAVNDFR